VGYRIAQSYYEHAEDKVKTLDDILTIRDFGEFLRASGYDGGSSPHG
jgi:hypothetical protein